MTQHLYSPESEMAVAGAMIGLDSANVMDIVTDILVPGMFHDHNLFSVATVCFDLAAAGKPIDLLTVSDALKKGTRYDALGGAQWLDTVFDRGCVLPHVRHHAEQVRDMYGRRLLLRFFREQAANVESAESAEEVRSKAEFALAQMARKDLQEQDRKDAVAAVLHKWDNASVGRVTGINTGYSGIDNYFSLEPQGFYLISGEQGLGKTTLLRNILEHAAEHKHPVALKTLEQSTEMIYGASIARYAKQSMWLLRAGAKRDELERAHNAAEYVLQLPYYVDDRPVNNAKLWTWARRMVGRHGCKVLGVDYLQCVQADDAKAGTEQRTTATADTLMQIPKELGCAMIAVSSLSYQGNLRGSSHIGYNVWAHVHMEWENKETNVVRANIAKNRFGPRNSFLMHLDTKTQRILEHGGVEEWK